MGSRVFFFFFFSFLFYIFLSPRPKPDRSPPPPCKNVRQTIMQGPGRESSTRGHAISSLSGWDIESRKARGSSHTNPLFLPLLLHSHTIFFFFIKKKKKLILPLPTPTHTPIVAEREGGGGGRGWGVPYAFCRVPPRLLRVWLKNTSGTRVFSSPTASCPRGGPTWSPPEKRCIVLPPRKGRGGGESLWVCVCGRYYKNAALMGCCSCMYIGL